MTPDEASKQLRKMSLLGYGYCASPSEMDVDELFAVAESVYKPHQLRDWRENVLSRDNRRCVMCGLSERLEAHHCKPKALFPDEALLMSNGVTLCFSCHRGVVHAGNTFDLSNWQVFLPLWESLRI